MKIYLKADCFHPFGEGWWQVVDEEGSILDEGTEEGTTLHRMQVMSALRAFQYCNKNDLSGVEVVTDSEVIYLGVTVWMFRWRSERGRKDDLQEPELWLDEMLPTYSAFRGYFSLEKDT